MKIGSIPPSSFGTPMGAGGPGGPPRGPPPRPDFHPPRGGNGGPGPGPSPMPPQGGPMGMRPPHPMSMTPPMHTGPGPGGGGPPPPTPIMPRGRPPGPGIPGGPPHLQQGRSFVAPFPPGNAPPPNRPPPGMMMMTQPPQPPLQNPLHTPNTRQSAPGKLPTAPPMPMSMSMSMSSQPFPPSMIPNMPNVPPPFQPSQGQPNHLRSSSSSFGKLNIIFQKGIQLKAGQGVFGRADPYLKIKLGDQTQKTEPHMSGGKNPVRPQSNCIFCECLLIFSMKKTS